MMKKILFILLLTFSFFSCSNNDENSNTTPTNESLIGKWEYFQVNSFPVGTTITGNETLVNWPHACSTKKDFMQFYSGGSLKIALYNSACMEDSGVINYVKTDVFIDIIENNITVEEWEIIELSNTTLKVKEVINSESEELMVLSFKKA